MKVCSRRRFLQTAVAAGFAAGALPLRAARGSATDLVTLGKSGVKVTRLAFGTGTFSGQVQRDLGQDQFTRLVRHAYDRGIRFFETSETYGGMHEMLGIALKGIPRDSYQLMSKVTTRQGVNPQEKIDALRKAGEHRLLRRDADALSARGDLANRHDTVAGRNSGGALEEDCSSYGASVHGLPALRRFPGNQWLQIAMIRMNHRGVKMDAEDFNTGGLGNVSEVVTHAKQVRRDGMGIISMKLVGEGAFTNREDRKAAMRFAFNNAGVDAVTVGYKSTAEVDEAIENLNLALA